MKYGYTNVTLLAGASLIALSSGAFAQEGRDEIVVTAQNREESVQDVPIAMNVFSEEQLKDAGITDLTAIKRLAPDVQITNDTQLTRVTLRGVGTNDNAETQDASIAINIDGEYLNRPTALNASLFDLERVEVLRGPQGTLYGRNATGGAINFVTRKPGDELSANGSVTYGNYDQIIAEGGITVPLGEMASFRIAGQHAAHDGYSYHPNVDRSSGDQDVSAIRGTLLLTPTERLEVMFAAEYITTDQTSPAQAWINLNAVGNRADETGPSFTDACSAPGWVEVAPLVAGVQCIPQNTTNLDNVDRHSYDSPVTGVGFEELEALVFRGNLTYDLGFATFTYRGGYRDNDLLADTTLSPAYIFKQFEWDSTSQSHEFRLNGDAGGILWQVGGFLFKERQNVVRGLYNPFIGPNGSYITFFSRPFVDTDSWAAFGQVDIPLTDQITLVAGGRYTDDSRSAQFDNYGFQFNAGPVNLVANGVPPATSQLLTTGADKFTWLAGINFEPTDDTLIYAKASTGFKAGGFDSVGAYAPETVTAYEIGTKNTFGGRYMVNLAAFYYDYSDLQAAVLLDSTVGGQVFNAGAATIWGIEGQFEALVTDNDRLYFTANYLNAEYDEFLASLPVQDLGGGLNGVGDLDGVPGNPVVQPNLAGNTPPRSPELVLTAGFEHIFPLNNGGQIMLNAFTRYNSGYYTTIFNWSDDKQDSFTQTDVSLEYVAPEGRWSLQAYARNLENTRELTYASFTSAGPDDIYNWQFGAPRTYGVRLAVDY